jgi:hypothetical protein
MDRGDSNRGQHRLMGQETFGMASRSESLDVGRVRPTIARPGRLSKGAGFVTSIPFLELIETATRRDGLFAELLEIALNVTQAEQLRLAQASSRTISQNHSPEQSHQ